MIRRAVLWAGLVAALAGAALPVKAQTADWAARVAQAARAAESAGSVDARLRALTELIVAQEVGQAALRRDMRVLAAVETVARDRLAAREVDLAGLLAALQGQGRGTAPLPMVHPQGALAAARAAGLTEAMVGALESERRDLAQDLEGVAQARAVLDRAAADLAALRAETAQARQALIAAAATNAPLPPAFDSAAAAALASGMETRTLSGLTGELTTRAPSGVGVAPRNLSLPVAARPVARGDGWLLPGGAGALVRAPVAATVLYAGPLRGYRTVLVLELAPRRLLVLAGLGQALVNSGTRVASGAALGFLPEAAQTSTQTPDLTTDHGAARGDVHGNVSDPALPAGSLPRDTLYMEARYADRPADLSQWFAVTEDE